MTNDNETKEDQLRDHVYDGIQEYDNQLPRWWVWKFVISVVFGVIYLFWFHFGGTGDSLQQEYEAELRDLEILRTVQANQFKPVTNDDFLALMDSQATLDQGAGIFAERCVSCHLADGGGLVGPNLTDDYWIHGNQPAEIYHIVEVGVPAKGMIPWKGTLSREEMMAVSVYVKSLHGKPVASAKAPEGEFIPEWKAP